MWCAAHGQTYVTLNFIHIAARDGIPPLLVDAYGVIRDHVLQWGDGVVEEGSGLVFNWLGHNGLSVHTWNSNGQLQTWKVLGEALSAVYNYMYQNEFGAADFVIYDGAKEVGRGIVG